MRSVKVTIFVIVLLGGLGLGPSSTILCVGAAHAILMASARQEAPSAPNDWVCARAGWVKGGRRTTDGPCHCHAVASKSTSCEERVEDKACNRYCRADKCSCEAAECR